MVVVVNIKKHCVAIFFPANFSYNFWKFCSYSHLFFLSPSQWNTQQTEHWRIQGGRQGRPPPPRGSKFFHFHAVFGKKLKNNSTFGSWRPPPPRGKSWIRHCREPVTRDNVENPKITTPWISYLSSVAMTIFGSKINLWRKRPSVVQNSSTLNPSPLFAQFLTIDSTPGISSLVAPLNTIFRPSLSYITLASISAANMSETGVVVVLDSVDKFFVLFFSCKSI